MSEQRSVRDLLAAADRERGIADGAENICRTFRLGSAVAVKRGLFGWRSATTNDDFRALTDYESLAIYEAAQIVKRDALSKAQALEAQVVIAKDQP